MKKLSKVLSMFLFLAVVLILSNTKSYATGIQYTDNLIPKMTSNTAPSGIASASDTYVDGNDSGDPWEAFDGEITMQNYGPYHVWITPHNFGWLAYEFPSSHIITKYTIQKKHLNTEDLGRNPKDWTFEAWDGTNWIVLDTQSNITDWINGTKKEFTFDNNNSYNKYRINITSNVSGEAILEIGELEMMETFDESAVKNLTAITEESNVKLAWDTVENATSYNIKRAETAGGPYNTAYATSNTNSFIDTNVTPGITYYYVVSAVVAGIEHSNSNEVSAKIDESSSSNILKVVVEVNEKLQLSVNDNLALNTNMTWTTSDSTVATVDASGIVKGVKAGNAVITVTNQDGTYSDTINILVIESETEVAIDLKVGDTRRLTIDDLAGTTSATWSSDSQAIATVSNIGKVTAVSAGTTYVIVKDDQGNEIGKICVRVRN